MSTPTERWQSLLAALLAAVLVTLCVRYWHADLRRDLAPPDEAWTDERKTLPYQPTHDRRSVGVVSVNVERCVKVLGRRLLPHGTHDTKDDEPADEEDARREHERAPKI